MGNSFRWSSLNTFIKILGGFGIVLGSVGIDLLEFSGGIRLYVENDKLYLKDQEGVHEVGLKKPKK